MCKISTKYLTVLLKNAFAPLAALEAFSMLKGDINNLQKQFGLKKK